MEKNKRIEVQDLTKFFPVGKDFLGRKRSFLKAVDGVSFTVRKGETLGLVGESGCGKTTLGQTIIKLIPPTSGRVLFDGLDVFSLSPARLRGLRRRMQIIFQDPYSSLNPRMTVGSIVGEGLKIHGLAKGKALSIKVEELLNRVGMDPDAVHRYPHEFSGGQRQRIGIARALSVSPSFIVCDEPVSALDVSIQAQVINLLIDLKEEFDLSYLFISHDLSVVRHVSDRVAVMYLGRIVEEGPVDRVFEEPGHPYTQALISAVPVVDPKDRQKRIILRGEVPSPLDPPSGCPFHTRCPKVLACCSKEDPPRKSPEQGHWYQCFLG
jgi:oligopeptide/dipeptide ABC transporter ATP-binding protein